MMKKLVFACLLLGVALPAFSDDLVASQTEWKGEGTGPGAVWPVTMQVLERNSDQISGTLHWPTLGNSKTRFKGTVRGSEIVFTEYELIQGNGVAIPTAYRVSLTGQSMSGTWMFRNQSGSFRVELVSNSAAVGAAGTVQVVAEDMQGGVQVRLLREQNKNDTRQNADGVVFYRTIYTAERIENGTVYSQVIESDIYSIDIYNSPNFNPIAMQPILFIDPESKVVTVFLSGKNPSRDYAMVGYAYRLETDGKWKKEVVFPNENSGWFSYFSGLSAGSPDIWHFRYAGYYQLRSVRNPDGTWRTMSVARISPDQAVADWKRSRKRLATTNVQSGQKTGIAAVQSCAPQQADLQKFVGKIPPATLIWSDSAVFVSSSSASAAAQPLEPDASISAIGESLTAAVAQQAQADISCIPPAPVAPSRANFVAKPEATTKGEFETTAAYEARRQKLQNEAEADAEKAYQQAMKSYEQALSQHEQRVREVEAKQADSKYYQDKLAQAWETLRPTQLGNLRISSIRYDADEQAFSALLKGVGSGLNMNSSMTQTISIPVSLEQAEKFKQDLESGKRVPVVQIQYPSMAATWVIVENHAFLANVKSVQDIPGWLETARKVDPSVTISITEAIAVPGFGKNLTVDNFLDSIEYRTVLKNFKPSVEIGQASTDQSQFSMKISYSEGYSVSFAENASCKSMGQTTERRKLAYGEQLFNIGRWFTGATEVEEFYDNYSCQANKALLGKMKRLEQGLTGGSRSSDAFHTSWDYRVRVGSRDRKSDYAEEMDRCQATDTAYKTCAAQCEGFGGSNRNNCLIRCSDICR
ncbi:MAG: hypothetical protein LBE50_06060 [Gallionellaceae bacterium]|jgi:hypothetical protein|nr:hypothetical protein [Gallionellaceae bacterium]